MNPDPPPTNASAKGNRAPSRVPKSANAIKAVQKKSAASQISGPVRPERPGGRSQRDTARKLASPKMLPRARSITCVCLRQFHFAAFNPMPAIVTSHKESARIKAR